jgi:hypothetical protein
MITGNMTTLISGIGGESVDVTQKTRIHNTGSKSILENPIIYGIISVGIVAFILFSVYCSIRLRECMTPVSSTI